MTKLEKDEIKEMLELTLAPLKVDIGYIKEQVTNTNNRVDKLETKTIGLEIENESNKHIKNFVYRVVGIGIGIASVVSSVITHLIGR